MYAELGFQDQHPPTYPLVELPVLYSEVQQSQQG